MKQVIALLVAVAVLVALAGLFVPENAATVGTTSISNESLDADLSAIAASPDYACFLYEQHMVATGAQVPLLGVGAPSTPGSSSTSGGVYDTAFVDDWLSSMITERAAAFLVARRGLRIDAADLIAGRTVLTRTITSTLDQYAREVGSAAPGCGTDGAAVLGSVPGWFAQDQVRAAADEALLAAVAARTTLSRSSISAYYDAHRLTFDRDCLSIIVVHTAVQAVHAETALSHGISFAAEATAVSLTRRSAADGGAAGCGELSGTFLGPDVAALRRGVVSRALHGDGLYWVVRLTGRSAPSFQTVHATVLTAMLAAGQARAGAELAAEIHASRITVDPRYGSLVVHGATLLVAPPSPPATAELSPSADQAPLTDAAR